MSNPFDPMRMQQERMRKQQQQWQEQERQRRLEAQRKQQEQMAKQGQDQLRKMQEESRQRQMKGAYYEQQKQQAAISPVADQFAEVERQAAELRQQHARGQLSEAEFKARLNDLMIQDASGTWWMVGMKGGEWYRSQGDKWVRASPAKTSSSKFAASGAVPRAAPKRHRLAALFTLPLGVVVSLVAGYILSNVVASVIGYHGNAWLPLLTFLGVLILGLVLTVRRVRKLWSGD